jgi:hypothetical protein
MKKRFELTNECCASCGDTGTMMTIKWVGVNDEHVPTREFTMSTLRYMVGLQNLDEKESIDVALEDCWLCKEGC